MMNHPRTILAAGALAAGLLLAACPDDVVPATPAEGDGLAAADAAKETQAPDITDDLPPAPPEVEEPVDSGLADGDTPDDAGPSPPEVTEDVAPPPSDAPSNLKAVLTAPNTFNLVVEVGSAVDFAGLVTDDVYPAEALTIRWSTDLEGIFYEGPPGLGGWTQISHTFTVPGTHTVTLSVENPTGESDGDSTSLGVCGWPVAETFDTDISGSVWQTYEDAYWDTDGTNGWLEMTGNLASKQGAIYNVGEYISPGDVHITFRILTGGGINTGADGFAMTVVDMPDVESLEDYISNASKGGCLGYGIDGPCGSTPIDAFHIEFDTWENDYDPTSVNHVAVTLDGNPDEIVLWEPFFLEDMEWHDVDITIEGNDITVIMDGGESITATVPGFFFHGGYIGFSGSTGWASNWHRFDDLLVDKGCQVPN